MNTTELSDSDRQEYEAWLDHQDAAYHQSMIEVQHEIVDLIDSLENSDAITHNEASMLRWATGVQPVEPKEQPQLEMAVTSGEPF